MPVLPPALRQHRIAATEFVQHPWSDPIVNEIVRVVPDHEWALHPFRTAPALESEYLFVECEGERAGPRLEFLVKELLKDRSECALCSNLLIAG